MKEDLPDIHEDAYHSDIYFALSWQSGFGERSAWNVVQILDQAAFRAIGDIKLPGKIDEDRIRRIMRDCSGFVCVLPFRGNSWTTSEWMFPEIRIAAEMKIPVIFFHEKNVDIQIERADMQTTVSFPGFQDSEKIDFQSKFYGPFPLEEDARQRDEMVRVQLQAFLEVCDHEENKKKPYAFFITRVQDDFMQARRAVETAVYNEAGLACIWTEPGRYSDHNNQQFQVQIKKLIKNAVFVIADLSFSNNNPHDYSLNRAHEIGMATAYEKPIFLCTCEPVRERYFSISDMQVNSWKDEKMLETKLRVWVQSNIRVFGRQIYNWELPSKAPTYLPKITRKEFRFQETDRFLPPSN